MEKYFCECHKCKAKFEVVADGEKNISCPGCGHRKVSFLEKSETAETGCGGCAGCHGCH